jgi:hypothetical protein
VWLIPEYYFIKRERVDLQPSDKFNAYSMAGEGSIGIVLSTALNINYNSKYQAFN